ncbi:rapamycin-insensitive companion of mTOR [Anopheles cruzii]|uniref:rapamycin-insensitive companion of mTOR n=1 Tax=Anopheles cruzii TaxID=68878 RepID=UPI0022EC8EC8|nr:rapamycin-insensitive companion of mTOR [Anopheles cruzii]
MAISSWMIRRSLRQRSRLLPEDCYYIDETKTPRENTIDVVAGLCSPRTSVNKRLSLLNALAKLVDRCKHDMGPMEMGSSKGGYVTAQRHACLREGILGFTNKQLMGYVSHNLLHQLPQIRAGALRALRHLLIVPEDLHVFNSLNLAHLVSRSLDVILRNDEERIQALKIVRRMLAVAPNELSPAVMRCLVALGESGSGVSVGTGGTANTTDIGSGEDRLLRCCLATLCEIGVLNPMLLIKCGGVSVITRNVLECHSPRIAESLCGVLLYMLEWPRTREIAAVHLDCFAAPYCDFTYRVGIMDRNKDARDLRFTCSRLALLSVLRSWAGTIEFCDPHRPSGLRALIEILYLNQLEIRKAVLDLLYELLGLAQPVWTDEYSVAMLVVDPAEYQDAWRLNEGFVAAEGMSILPSLAGSVPNLCEIHLALLLYCFVENGLLNALIEVIISSDTFISVRATILLAKITYQLHHLLPAEICALTPAAALPMLVARAIEGNHQARAAISALQQFHLMLQNRPASCSLYLDCIIQSGELINTRTFRRELSASIPAVNVPTFTNFKYSTLDGIKRTHHDSISNGSRVVGSLFGQVLSPPNGSSFSRQPAWDTHDSNTMSGKRAPPKRNKLLQLWDSIKESDRLIKESHVLLLKDPNMWDWDIIITILRSEMLGMKLEDQNNRFVRRLVDYFKPSNNRFSHQDLMSTNRQLPAYVTAGLELIDAMLQSPELECIRILTDLFTDISRQLLAIHAKKSAHECLFSPQHMTSTMCQQYFLFIGRMCRTEGGMEILRNTDVFKELSTIVSKTNHLCYIKLIISGLDYTMEGEPRSILAKALLKHPSAKARLYSIQMLRVLLRARLPNFEVWGIQLMLKLVGTMQGESQPRCIVLAVVDLLEEACYERVYLEELAYVWPQLDRLGDRAKMVMMRFYSIPRGLNHPAAQVVLEIEQWVATYNERYVLLVESDTHANLTQHVRSEDGTYSRRHCTNGTTNGVNVAANLLPHLYGQLAQTYRGFSQLLCYGKVDELMAIVRSNRCRDERDCLQLKMAIWATCHACTSKEAIELVKECYAWFFGRLVQLVRSSDVYSIRATTLGGLCLIASTSQGAAVLQTLGWVSVRHDRNTHWPIKDPYSSFSPETTSLSSKHAEDDYHHVLTTEEDEKTTDTKQKVLENSDISSPSPQHFRAIDDTRCRLSFISGSPVSTSSNATDARSGPIGSSGMDKEMASFSQVDSHSYRKHRYMSARFPSYFGKPVQSFASIDEDLDLRWKIRSLDRKYRNESFLTKDDSAISMPTPISTLLTSTNTTGPCYMGICFPSNILLLFPENETRQTHVFHTPSERPQTHPMKEKRKPVDTETRKSECQSISTIDPQSIEKNDVDYEQLVKIGAVRSASPVTNTSAQHDNHKRWSHENHNKAQCLRCCWKALGEQFMFEKKATNSAQSSTDDAPETFDAIPGEKIVDENIANSILRHVQRMANPVWNKQSRSVLLDAKQSHPDAFQDVCLYSEVCHMLSQNTFRLVSRRFLQELFLDLHSGVLYDAMSSHESDVDKPADFSVRSDSKHTSEPTASVTHTVELVAGKTHAFNYSAMLRNQAPLLSPGAPGKMATAGGVAGFLLKSPPLASVYEASLENLDELSSTPQSNKAKVVYVPGEGAGTSDITVAGMPINKIDSSTVHTSTTKDEPQLQDQDSKYPPFVKQSGHKFRTRPRFNTLELDLSCVRNKFPIRDRSKIDYSPTRPPVLSCVMSSGSSSSFVSTTSSASAVTSPTQTMPIPSFAPLGSLFCEQRQQLKSSKSENTLMNT